jgi:cholesterol transport system auxiliary component
MRYALVLVVAACALTKKSEPVEVHYFTPMVPTGAQGPAHETPRARVRLGRIWSSSHLRYAIARRTSPVELTMYEFDRWTDTPDVYVKRSIEQALFQERPIEQATSGNAVSLDVDVIAFEEVKSPPGGRVQLRFSLRDEHSVIASDTVTVVRKARGAALADTVVAIGEALDDATTQIGDRVLETVARH